MTLEELGAACDSSKSYMWEIENKIKSRPSAHKLDKIAEALQLPISYFLDDNQEQPSFDKSEEMLLKGFRKLPKNKKEQLLKIMRIL